MLRWGGLLAAALVGLALTGTARAQLPSPGSSGMNYVPVDTTRNLAAPIPVVPVPPKKSLLSRTYSSVKSVVPFVGKSTPNVSPMMPTAMTPKNMPQPQQPAQASGPTLLQTVNNFLSLKPKVSDVVSGSAR
ncbi:MAG: hypothetical protein ACJ8F7_11535 [Gemmataceae bacterium]